MELFGNRILKKPDSAGLFSDTGLEPRDEYRGEIASAAEDALAYELTPLTASLYKDFAETGNRARFENVYHGRRRALTALLLGSICADDERYTKKAVDIVWAICEETTWVIPAHNVSRGYILHNRPLFDSWDDIPEVDLFSAATGSLLCFVLRFLGERMDAVTGGVMTERIKYEVGRRIIGPFLKYEMRWMYSFVNNWVPWIISNILVCGETAADNANVKMTVINRSIDCLDRFVGTYGEDCGCNEGASYWGAAIGTLFDACEILYDITGGAVDALGSPFLKKACRFIADMCVDPEEGLYINYADCPPRLSVDGDMVYRMGRRLGDGVLADFGRALRKRPAGDPKQRWTNSFFPYRLIKDLFDRETADLSAARDECAFYRDMQAAVLRRGGFTVFVKGGHNRESHNHNDVGSFMLYRGDTPVFIDPGNLEYTRDTFNENRYKIWTNQSSFHNLPEIGGVMQGAGREFAADAFECGDDGVYVSFASAYPAESGAVKAERRVKADGASVAVTDNVECPGDCVFNFITCVRPVISGNTASVADVRVTFSGAGDISVEPIDVSGSGTMKHGWRTETLYRIRVRAKKLVTEAAAL